jgi:hypothetical protein
MRTAQMRQRAEAIGPGQVQVQQQQIGSRMPLERIEQTGDAFGLEDLAVGTRRPDRTLERRAVQRMVIDDENFVSDPQARRRPARAGQAAETLLGCRRKALSSARSAAGRSGLWSSG